MKDTKKGITEAIAKWIMSCVYRTRHDGTSFTRMTIPIQDRKTHSRIGQTLRSPSAEPEVYLCGSIIRAE
jgi:hypothetical protein